MGNYAYFSQDYGQLEESVQALWGSLNICPTLTWLKIEVILPELLELSHAGAWGSTEKPCGDMAFLLIAHRNTIDGEMAFGLATVWAHPYQAHLSSLDEVVRNLTLLINLTDNLAYAFVQLNEDAQHIPLSNKGQSSAMVDEAPCRSACGCLHWLEVGRLLQYGDQVVYLEGLNGGL